MSKPYDWVWRKNGPMTFRKIYMEAIEVCSPELFLRRLEIAHFLMETWMHGLYPEVDRKRARRLVAQAFVRAYLVERRAGIPPREPGPPAETEERVNRMTDLVDALALAAQEKVRQKSTAEISQWRANQWRAMWTAVGTMAAEDRG